MGSRIHTVIFDMDGTLSDSAVLTEAAFRLIAPGQGLPVPSEDAIRRVMGNATPEFYYMLFPGFPRDVINETGKLVDEEELRILPSFGDRLLFPGCRELLVRLKENKIRLYLASTGAEAHVSSVLGGTGIIDLFEKISCGRPNKTGMLGEMVQGGDREGYVMVGDMQKDHEGARANGIVSVGACYGYCKRELTDFDYYIDAPLELLEIIHLENPQTKKNPDL